MVEKFLIFRSQDSKLQTRNILEHIPFFECACCWKNLHITWIKKLGQHHQSQGIWWFSPYSIGWILTASIKPWDSEGLPNLNNLPTWFHKGNGDGPWLVGGYGWMFTHLPHLWCGTNFSRFLRLKSSGSNKKSVGEKIQICGFFGLTKMSLPNMEHLLKEKQNKKQMDVFEESKLRSKISCILLGLPFENPTVTHLVELNSFLLAPFWISVRSAAPSPRVPSWVHVARVSSRCRARVLNLKNGTENAGEFGGKKTSLPGGYTNPWN